MKTCKHPTIGKTILHFLCFLLCITANAQDIFFRHLTSADGLSHNSVTSIYQDERGIIWFGTRNGVSLYNGKGFMVYKREKDNANSLLHNQILNITGDKNGHVYILTIRGVTAYDIEKDEFSTLKTGAKAQCMSDGKLYVLSPDGINVYRSGKSFMSRRLPSVPLEQTSGFYVSNDSIFISSRKRNVYLFPPDGEAQQILPIEASRIFKDSRNCYWMMDARKGTGAYAWHPNGGIKHYVSVAEDAGTLSSNITQSCCEDQEGNIWIGTFDGLNKFNPATGEFTRYKRCGSKGTLTHSSIKSLYCDRQGTVWAGTYFGGVNYFNTHKRIYKEYHISEEEPKGLSSPIVGRIIEDKNSNLWICTEGGGLNKLDSLGRIRKYLSGDSPSTLSHNNIKAIYYDSIHSLIWVGTHMGGLNKFDMKTERFVRYRHRNGDAASLPSDIISDIIPYKGSLLLATHNGIAVFTPASGKSRLLLTNKADRQGTKSTLDLQLDHTNKLWIVNNNNGVCSYDFHTKRLRFYKYSPHTANSISSNSVNSVFMDSKKRLWFCTNENGLDLYRPSTDDFQNYDMLKNGLASNVVYNVCELSPDTLLVTTDKGISILDCLSGRFENYDELPLDYINENSLARTKKGEVYIGGVNGLISFSPSDLKKTERPYSIIPFRLLVNGEEVKVQDGGILSKSLAATKEITLSARHSVFTLEYAVTDYIPFNKDKIVYRLEGFSNEWTDANDRRFITFTNLDAGEYTLIIKALNRDEKLIPPYRLKIKVLPPLYLTTWACFAYAVCAVAAICFWVRAYKRRIRLQESLKYEKKHAEDIEKLNHIKLRFFTNISHEFRTPLTLITGQIEMLLQNRSLAPGLYDKVASIYRNCLLMKNLITELLDFRKQEQGFMKIKASEHNVVDFVYKHYQLFQDYARRRNITFRFLKMNDEIRLWYDARQMSKVLNNLISNAFKHTKEGDTIVVAIKQSKNEVAIEVADTGKGIPPKDLGHIFERFYQTDMSETGTGIGLALAKGIIDLHHGKIEVTSELNEGTTFTVRLLTGNEHFNPEQIKMEEVLEEQSVPASPNDIEYHTPMIPNNLEGNGTKYKALIVEDNAALCRLLADIFSPIYQVVIASDGCEGLQKIYEENPDIVVSDIVMPKMSGIELCKAVKKDFEICHIPVILLTACASNENNLESLKLGADDYITKPFDANILLARCNNLINNRKLLQEKFCKQPQADVQMLATNTMDKEFIDKIINVIEKRIDDANFNIDCIAEEIGYSRSRLFRKMKAVTGQTPAEFVMVIRLKRAATMLRQHPELSVSEISDQLGFGSAKYFSKCFKDRYRMAPLAYRKGEDQHICP